MEKSINFKKPAIIFSKNTPHRIGIKSQTSSKSIEKYTLNILASHYIKWNKKNPFGGSGRKSATESVRLEIESPFPSL
jgi:hypothetical protein